MFCRSEAAKLHEQKPAFDAAGCDLVCLLKENIPEEVSAFNNEEYWPSPVYLDNDMTFFKALGGGNVRKGSLSSLLSLLNPWSTMSKKYKAIKNDVKDSNLNGEGTIFGGLYVVSNQGIHYQYVEKDFGDAAPVDEVLDACRSLDLPGVAAGAVGGG